jgi:hypothetical protein
VAVDQAAERDRTVSRWGRTEVGITLMGEGLERRLKGTSGLEEGKGTRGG